MTPLTDICRSQLNDRNNDFPFHDKASEDYDCNVAMTSEAVQLVTGTKLTAAQIRQLGGVPGARPTGSVLTRQVFRTQNMVAGTDYVAFNGAPTADIKDLLMTGWYVVGYIMYSKLGELEPTLVCDDYKGAHAVGIFDWYRAGGTRRVHMADPLADGRLSGGLHRRVWKGVQAWPWSAVRAALWEYNVVYGPGTGYISGYAVTPK